MIDQHAFELYLMTLMRGSARIDSALLSLGISCDSMRAVARHVASCAGFLDLVPHELGTYVDILGAPAETIVEPGTMAGGAFGGSRRHRFHLQLWSDFDFILRTNLGGWVWGPEFVRRPGVSVPVMEDVCDLCPWTVLDTEVVARFGPFASEEAWNLGKDATYVVDRVGAPVEIALVFDLGLLQRVDCHHIPSSSVA